MDSGNDSDLRFEDDGKVFVHAGDYLPGDARRLLLLLEGEDVDFRIEKDDSALKGLDPFAAASGGAFGFGTLTRVYVEESGFQTFELIRDTLYPT